MKRVGPLITTMRGYTKTASYCGFGEKPIKSGSHQKTMLKKKKPVKKKYPKKKHRSKFETSFNNLCIVNGYTLGYETSVLPFVTPPEKRRYHPDWTIKEGWYIETKGLLDAAGRKKLCFIKQQYPTTRILVVFQRHQNKIYKTSKTTYSQWCDKEGIEWCDFKSPERILGFIREALTQV